MSLEFETSGLKSDIFGTGAEALVNPVNCVGAMGKGLAEAFATRYPAILPPYKQACAARLLVPGKLLTARIDPATGDLSDTGSLYIVNFPTKHDWKNRATGEIAPSKIEWIDAGLAELASWIRETGVKSIAVPQLGCGLGGLKWRDVAGLIQKHLGELEGVRVMALGPNPGLKLAPANAAPGAPTSTQTHAKPATKPASVDVLEFQGEFRWASNMYKAPVAWGDQLTPVQIWDCNELPYVLSKTIDLGERATLIKAYTEAEANRFGTGAGAIKKLGRPKKDGGIVTLRDGWDAKPGELEESSIKFQTMVHLNRDKYARNPLLAKKLLATGEGEIREGNWWGDVYWGVATKDIPQRNIRAGQGQNHLGKITKRTRSALASGELKPITALPAPLNFPMSAPTAAQQSLFKDTAMLAPKSVVNLRSFKRGQYPADLLDCSRYGTATFRDGTKLGNPFVMSEHGGKDGSREDVIRKHADKFADDLKKPGFPAWLAEVTSGKNLGCFCAPAACHCDTIKAAATAVIEGRDPFEAIAPFRRLGLAAEQANSERRDFDYTGIGSRDTPQDVLEKMQDIAEELAKRGWTLRSGGADGADINFEKGCDRANGKKRIFLPWSNFSARIEIQKTGYVPVRKPGQVKVGVSQAAMDLAGKHHPKWSELPDSHKKLHSRNGYQVLEENLDKPTDAIVCWTEGGQLKGGTSQALRLAATYGIQPINLGSDRWKNASVAEIVAEVERRALERATAPKPVAPAEAASPAPLRRPAEPVAMPTMKNRGLMR